MAGNQLQHIDSSTATEIPILTVHFPPGKCPQYRIPKQVIESWVFIGNLPLVSLSSDGSFVMPSIEEWLLDDDEPDESLQELSVRLMQTNWDTRYNRLLDFYRTPEGVEYCASFLCECIEECSFLARDSSEALLWELKNLVHLTFLIWLGFRLTSML
jgi:hypothetical protein